MCVCVYCLGKDVAKQCSCWQRWRRRQDGFPHLRSAARQPSFTHLLIQTIYIHWGPVVVRPKCKCVKYNTHTHTSLFNSPFSGITRLSWYQKGKTNLDFTEARDSEWQWHQLGHMQVCISLQTDSHASTPPLSCLQAGCPSCRPTNSVKALKINVYLSQVTTTASATAATPV